MLSNLNCWDVDKVKSFFNPLVSTAILKIHLSLYPRPNTWVWFEEKHEKFIIKSAYLAIQKSRRRSRGDCSNLANLNLLCKQLWQLRALHKIKFLLGG